MNTSFYILACALAGLATVNLFRAKAEKRSKVRTFGLWFNGFAIGFLAIAVIIMILK